MKNIKINVAISILLFINLIFIYKYSLRITNFALYISIAIVLVQLFFFRFDNKIRIPVKWISIFYYTLLVLLINTVIFSYLKIPVESLNVDRWSVINSFIDEMLKGNYPYFAKSHENNYPGPMPIYFLLVFPFYLIGELAIYSALGYIVYLVFVKKQSLNTNFKTIMFYLATSVFVFWEIATRSNVFTNTVFIVFLFVQLIKLELGKGISLYLLALLSGFLLCTRSIFLLTYIIFFLPILLKRDISLKKLILFISIAIIGFIIPFIPLLIFFKDDFFTMNPFIVQSTFFIPQIYTIGFIFISVIFSFRVRNKSDIFFYSGLSLFIAIFIYSIYNLILFGFQKAYIDSVIDISYFIFCIPFLLMYLTQAKLYEKNI